MTISCRTRDAPTGDDGAPKQQWRTREFVFMVSDGVVKARETAAKRQSNDQSAGIRVPDRRPRERLTARR